MNIDTFKQELTAQNYGETTTIERPAGYNLGTHEHPFDAKALITRGDITLVVNGVSTVFTVGDVFELAAGTPHEEHALPHGVTYVVGRRKPSDRPRPFKVLGIQQIAIGGTSKAKLRELWVDMLGLEVTGNFRSERENVDEDICAMGSGAFKVEVDLMEPIDPSGKPAVHTTPLNHVGLWIDDLPKAVEWLTAKGVRFAPGGIRKGAAGYDITFLHPKSNDEFPIAGEGVLIELVQAPPVVILALSGS
jgi:lactoylglutathione lyase